MKTVSLCRASIRCQLYLKFGKIQQTERAGDVSYSKFYFKCNSRPQ